MYLRGFGVLAVLTALLSTPAAARDIDVGQATIADINAALKAGTLTSEKLVELSLARIAAYEDAGPALNAIIGIRIANTSAGQTANTLFNKCAFRVPRYGMIIAVNGRPRSSIA